jgi:phospholipase/carboxylesterase
LELPMTDTATRLDFIHRHVPAADPARKPLLLLHGTGADENDLVPLGQRLSPGAALISPRGKVLENGMPRFFRRLEEGVFDREDLAFRTGELAQFVGGALITYKLAAPLALGFSNGANIAWSLLFARPDLLAGAILMRPMLPFDPRPLPNLAGKPVLILTGAQDPIAPEEQAGLLAALLGEAGADVAYEVVPGGHGLTGYDLQLAAGWLKRHG